MNIDAEISEDAVEFSLKNNLHTVVALIYSSALKNNSMLVTLDNDFKGLTGALTLKG
mgnify:FL=1